ncbi:MAG: gamma-glutamyl-phosphate reductase, partial [Paracoccaceae bacterium]
MTTEKIEKLMNTIGQKAKSSANSLAYSDPEKKRKALLNAAKSVLDNKIVILEANKEDISSSVTKGL